MSETMSETKSGEKRSRDDRLQEDRKKLMEQQDNNGLTALHICAQYKRVEIMKQFLQVSEGVDFNKVDKKGCTALFPAIETGDWDTVNAVLELGVDTLIPDCEGKLPLQAAVSKDPDLAKKLRVFVKEQMAKKLKFVSDGQPKITGDIVDVIAEFALLT